MYYLTHSLFFSFVFFFLLLFSSLFISSSHLVFLISSDFWNPFFLWRFLRNQVYLILFFFPCLSSFLTLFISYGKKHCFISSLLSIIFWFPSFFLFLRNFFKKLYYHVIPSLYHYFLEEKNLSFNHVIHLICNYGVVNNYMVAIVFRSSLITKQSFVSVYMVASLYPISYFRRSLCS